jgi:hypothetical protein
MVGYLLFITLLLLLFSTELFTKYFKTKIVVYLFYFKPLQNIFLFKL